jgi:four helix bundle protein
MLHWGDFGHGEGVAMGRRIESHFELDVYKKAFEVSMELFRRSKKFPKEEMYSLTDQVRRASRSVCANLAEGWRKRVYEAAFVAKLVDAEGEAGETQTWIQYAVACEYLDRETGAELFRRYDEILRMLVAIRTHPKQWCLSSR